MSNIIASLVANITANTTGLESGLAKTKTALNTMAAQGSYAGDSLGASFQKAVYGVNNAANATNAAGGAVTRWDKLVSAALPNLGRFGNSALQVSGALQGISATAATVGIAAVGLAAGSVALYKMSEAGAQLDYTRQKFDRLSVSMGTTGDIMLDKLRVATKGTLSDFQLTQQGTDLFQLGLAKTSDEAVRLSSVMTALGMDTGELTLALANQSKRRLDQLGLSLTEFNKNEAIFKQKGLSKEDAFTQAFLTTAEQTVEKVGNKGDSAAGSFDRLNASWTNLKDSFKLATADTFTGFNNALSKTIDLFSKKSLVDEYNEAIQKAGRNPFSNNYEKGYDIFRSRKAESARYQGLAALYSGASGGAAPVVDTTDYANLLKVSSSLTNVTASYNDKLNQLAEKLIDAPKNFGATAEQADQLKKNLTGLTNMTGEYNIALMQQLNQLTAAEGEYGKNDARVRDLREGINALRQDMVQANNDMLMSTMKNAGATDQQQLQFAQASGMISEQAFQQSMALAKISEAYISNKISADQAANAARGVMTGLSSINGFNAVGYVDIYVRVHGGGATGISTSTGSAKLGAGAGAIGYDTRTGGPILRNATGGPMMPGGISKVSEYGEPEIFNAGGSQYLIAGGKGGYISPMRGSNRNGSSGLEAVYALVSRIPSAEENARALVKAMKAVF